jgi:hypothetical protein
VTRGGDCASAVEAMPKHSSNESVKKEILGEAIV